MSKNKTNLSDISNYDILRFFSKVDFINGCWLWNGVKGKCGHGRFSYKGKLWMASRFSYEHFIGPLEKGYFALHREICGNHSCVKPDHLYAGTIADNNRDRMEWGAGPLKPHQVLKGENHGSAILTEKNVVEILGLRKTNRMKYKNIAIRFGVSPNTIGKICRGEIWKHIKIQPSPLS